MKPTSSQIIATIMTMLFIISISWIAYNYFEDIVEEQKQSAFVNGTYYGSQQVIFEIVDKASRCEDIDLNVYNTTFRLREVRCD